MKRTEAFLTEAIKELGKELRILQLHCKHPLYSLSIYPHAKRAYKKCLTCGVSETIETNSGKFIKELERIPRA